MPYRLNDLTQAEMAAIRDKALRPKENRNCLWCEKEVMMQKTQKFCCASCRVKFANAAAQHQLDTLNCEKARWAAERAELVAEIASLRHQLANR